MSLNIILAFHCLYLQLTATCCHSLKLNATPFHRSIFSRQSQSVTATFDNLLQHSVTHCDSLSLTPTKWHSLPRVGTCTHSIVTQPYGVTTLVMSLPHDFEAKYRVFSSDLKSFDSSFHSRK